MTQHDVTEPPEPGSAGPVTVGSPAEWRTARLALLEKEKQLNRLRDELAAERRHDSY